MSQIIEVPGQGEVEFPDTMSDAEIAAVLKGMAPPRPSFAEDFVSGLGLGAQSAKAAVVDPVVGVGETGLRLFSQGVAYPIALGRGAREDVNQRVGGRFITMPPPGHPAAPRYGSPPVGPDGEPVSYEQMTPEQQAQEQEAWQRENALIRSRGARQAGNEERASATRGLTYDPHTKAGQQTSAAFDSLMRNTLGRVLNVAGSVTGGGAATVSRMAGQEKPEQEAWRASADELGQLGAGMAISKLSPAIGRKARTAAEILSERLEQVGINQGRKVLTGNAASSLTTKVPLSPEAVKAAYDSGAIRAFGTVQRAEEVLWGLREKLGGDYGALLTELEARGVRGPNAIRLVEAFRREADQVSKMTAESVNPTARLLRQAAEKDILPKADPRPFADKTLSLKQAEGMKRDYQSAARDAYHRPGHTMLGDAQKNRASSMRQAIEDAVEGQADKAPDLVSQFVPLKQKLGPVIEASDAAQNAVSRAAARQDFGLGAKVMAAGGLASGNPLQALAALFGSRALRNRGPATYGSTAMALSKALRSPAPLPVPSAQLATLLEAVRERQADPLPPPIPLRWPVAVPAAAADEEGRR